MSILRSDPTTDRHGGFDLLRLRPGSVHPSLDDLVVPSSPRSTISIPNLVRTPDRHSLLQPRSPELKRSASLSLPVAWITGAATEPGESQEYQRCCSTCCSQRPLVQINRLCFGDGIEICTFLCKNNNSLIVCLLITKTFCCCRETDETALQEYQTLVISSSL